MKKFDLFAELAIVTEQLMAQRSMNFDSAFIMCNEMLTEITNGAVYVSVVEVHDVVKELRTRLNLTEDKGGAR